MYTISIVHTVVNTVHTTVSTVHTVVNTVHSTVSTVHTCIYITVHIYSMYSVHNILTLCLHYGNLF